MCPDVAAAPTEPVCPGLSASLPAAPCEVRRFLTGLPQRTQPLGLSTEQLQGLEIVLAEVLNNIVEHAYRNAKDGRIELRLCRSGDRLLVDLVDAGIALPGLRLPEPTVVDPDLPHADLPEGGFGWGLIRELTVDVVYHRRQDRNHTRLILDLG